MDNTIWLHNQTIKSQLKKVIDLVNSGVFHNASLELLRESVFTEIMIHLNDLLQGLKNSHRVNFKDDIPDDHDITDLINSVRNAVCHIQSGERKADKKNNIILSFCIVDGLCPNAINIHGIELGCDYSDDMAFLYGTHRVYWKRHIIRVIEEIQKIYIQEEKLKKIS
jgi:hypothetical protein